AREAAFPGRLGGARPRVAAAPATGGAGRDLLPADGRPAVDGRRCHRLVATGTRPRRPSRAAADLPVRPRALLDRAGTGHRRCPTVAGREAPGGALALRTLLETERGHGTEPRGTAGPLVRIRRRGRDRRGPRRAAPRGRGDRDRGEARA